MVGWRYSGIVMVESGMAIARERQVMQNEQGPERGGSFNLGLRQELRACMIAIGEVHTFGTKIWKEDCPWLRPWG